VKRREESRVVGLRERGEGGGGGGGWAGKRIELREVKKKEWREG